MVRIAHAPSTDFTTGPALSIDWHTKMIVDIPAPQELQANGTGFLNLAWETVIAPTLEAKQVSDYGFITEDEYEDLVEKYWIKRQHQLSVGVALAQQGTEFLLKSKIAQISPFLLIASDVSKWPNVSKDISYSDFQTVDAQYLLKLHDAVCNPRLPDTFKTEYERLRRLRNSVMHSVDKKRIFTAQNTVFAILLTANTLLGPGAWPSIRMHYYQERDLFWAEKGRSPNGLSELAKETLYVVDELLKPAEAERYYGLIRDNRRYLCPGCTDTKYSFDAPLAQLSPNTPESTNVYCVCCCTLYVVFRKDCQNKKCKGNVIDEENETCLTCGAYCPEE